MDWSSFFFAVPAAFVAIAYVFGRDLQLMPAPTGLGGSAAE